MVSIKISEGLWGKVTIVNSDTKEQLWQGKSGQTAQFEMDGSVPVEIIWGIFQTPNAKETVTDGTDYELIFRMGPFGAKYSIVEAEKTEG
ncbi:MAG: hypothetical protein K6E75_00875 [Lachnospiraceae bacterium]|nr:hypothetical protein [Lachnospiraceae bacterium]